VEVSEHWTEVREAFELLNGLTMYPNEKPSDEIIVRGSPDFLGVVERGMRAIPALLDVVEAARNYVNTHNQSHLIQLKTTLAALEPKGKSK